MAQRQIARKLYATMWWLLFVPAALTVAFMFVRAVHDGRVKTEAFACWQKEQDDWQDVPMTDAEVLEWQELEQRKAASSAKRASSDVRRAEQGIGQKQTETTAQDDHWRQLAQQELATRNHCGITVMKYGVYASNTWGSGANNLEHWWEFLYSLFAFVPVGLLMMINRWWRWLVRPESPSPPKSTGPAV